MLTELALAAGLGVAGVAARVHLLGRQPPRWPERPLPVVVLGARVFPDGTPSRALVERVRVGAALLAEGRGTVLVCSGGGAGPSPEAEVMATLARAAGVAAERLVLERESRSTFENARACAPLLAALGAREVLLVTCDFHLARATAQFRARGFRVWPVPSPRQLPTWVRAVATGREVGALLRRPWLLWPR